MMRNKFFYMSILLHGLLLSFSIKILWDRESTIALMRPVQTYVYHTITRNKYLLQSEQAAIIHSSAQKTNDHHEEMEYQPTLPNKKKIETEPLISILHNAIAENQIYPEAALALNQSGTVKISFMLYPNGELGQAKIEKSSGFSSIDSAALASVKAIVSIPEAGQYLHQAEYFAIDVLFAL